MCASKALFKRLDEFQWPDVRVAALRSSLNLPAEFLLPFLLQHKGAASGLPVLVVTLSESPANFVFLAKRAGLNLQKLKNVTLVDGMSVLASQIESHYPLTSVPPFTHFENAPEPHQAAPDLHSSILKLQNVVQQFAQQNPDGLVAVCGLEILQHLAPTLLSDPVLFSFVHSIFRNAPKTTILGFDESLKHSNPTLVNFLKSSAQLDLRLKDLQSGFSSDFAGTLELRERSATAGRTGAKRLKVVIANGTIDFVDQIKIV